VNDLEQNIRFYSALFAAQPSKIEADYAKWMLDDPCINFAISTRSEKTGVDHLGIQVDSQEELQALRERLRAADLALFDEGETVCCYARSDKTWVKDPSGVAWETYQTMADAQLFSSESAVNTGEQAVDQTPASATRSCC
jgi:hypothetical protein